MSEAKHTPGPDDIYAQWLANAGLIDTPDLYAAFMSGMGAESFVAHEVIKDCIAVMRHPAPGAAPRLERALRSAHKYIAKATGSAT